MRAPILPLMFLVLFALPRSGAAQPSDAQVKKDYSRPGVLSVVISADARLKELNPVTGLWEYSCRITVTSKSTEYPGLNVVVKSEVEYVQKGGKWVNVTTGISANSYFEGLPNPTPKELAAFIKATGWKALIGTGYYSDIVGEVERYEVAPDAKFAWPKPTVVEFPVVAEFRRITSATEVKRVRVRLMVTLARDDIKGPWTKVVSALSGGRAEELGTETFSAEEVRRMRTLSMVEDERRVAASKTVLTVPTFGSAMEPVEYAYKLLKTATPEEWESFVRQTLVKHPMYMVPGSDTLLNQRGKDKIDLPIARVIKLRAQFQRQFCPTIKIKSQQIPKDGGLAVTFTDKGDTSNCNIRVALVGGKFLLADINLYPVRNPTQVEAISVEQGCPH